LVVRVTLIHEQHLRMVMSDEEGEKGDGSTALPGVRLTSALQDASEEALEQQAELLDVFLSGSGGSRREQRDVGFTDRLSGFGSDVGAFKARVQTSGRVSIPDTEREALGIEEEDLVQVFVVPVERQEKENEQ
jgi:hypothetical protein